MSIEKLNPKDAAKVDEQTEDHRTKQPYASELDDRELEHAQKERRPIDPKGQADKPEA